MKVMKFAAVLLLAVGMFSATAIAQDTCPTAINGGPAPTAVPGLQPCADTSPTGTAVGSCATGNNPFPGGVGILDVWMAFQASATAHRIRTDIGSLGSDSDYGVYKSASGALGDCGTLSEIGCSEDEAPPYLGDICVGGLTVGATYYVRLGTWDDGCPNGPYTVTVQAATGPTCGDGVVSCVPGAEQCDDGNTTGGDCCSATCQLEVICGNGCVESPEQCDDHNTISGDGCSSTCRNEIICGNNLVEAGEQCDGTGSPQCAGGSYCATNCKCVVGIPAVSEWGLAVLTLIGLVSGTILFGRRRVAVR